MSSPVSPDSSCSASSSNLRSLSPERKVKYLKAKVAFLSGELEELARSNLGYQQRLASLTESTDTTDDELSSTSAFPADSQCARELAEAHKSSLNIMKLEGKKIYELSISQVRTLEDNNSKLRAELNKLKTGPAAYLEQERQKDIKKLADEMAELRDRNQELREFVGSLPDDGRRALVIENHNLHLKLANLKAENDNTTKALDEQIADHSVLEFRFKNQTLDLRVALEGVRAREGRVRELTRGYDRLVRRYRELFGLLNEMLGGDVDEDVGSDDESDGGGVGIEEEEVPRPILRVVNED
ncbi:hypothetical protein MMC30_002676 [Trapelia coarctata]|nr:hypothetical protein [Trapelia coarctata]